MRALLISDEVFAIREQAMLSRLEVGLADEGVAIAHALPASMAGYAPASIGSPVTLYHPPRWRVSLAPTARAITASLAQLDDQRAPARVDIVHAFGGAAWSLASRLAKQLSASLAIELWRANLADKARSLLAEHHAPVLFLSPDPALSREIAPLRPPPDIRNIPWGVHTPPQPKPLLDPARSPAVMIIGAGRDPHAFAAALQGLAAIIHADQPLALFVDADAGARASLHPVAKRLNLLPHLSFIGDLEGRRDLILQGDFLLQPEARGEQRSITLDAMAVGMVVLAAADPAVAALQQDSTAHLIHAPSPALWEAALRRFLSDPNAAHHLARSAREHTRARHLASDHVARLLDAYRSLTTGNALPFSSPPASRT